MDNVDIVFIINSFNRHVLLNECLSALETWIPHSVFKNRCAAVIYDAGSTDGSIDVAQEAEKKLSFQIEIILSQLGEDTSFAAGLNRGVSYAEKKFPKLAYLFFYETDNQILTSAPLTQALSQLTSRASLGACGFTVRQHNGNLAGVGEPFPTLLNFALGKNIVHHFQLDAIPYRWEQGMSDVEFSHVDVVYTSPLLVKLEAWHASGGLDSKCFPFSDCDVDWARRLRNLGWHMGVIRSDYVIHDNQAAISTWSKSRAMHSARGRLRYFQRHRPLSVFVVWPGLLLLRHLLEFTGTKLLVKDPTRRMQLAKQFLELLKACPKKYEQA
jgi:GT2 family glycosyltransferase